MTNENQAFSASSRIHPKIPGLPRGIEGALACSDRHVCGTLQRDVPHATHARHGMYALLRDPSIRRRSYIDAHA